MKLVAAQAPPPRATNKAITDVTLENVIRGRKRESIGESLRSGSGGFPPGRPYIDRSRGARGTPRSPDWLADRQKVALTVPEPGASLAAAALARVVPGDLDDPVNRRQLRQVVLLEHHTTSLELGDDRLDVVHLPGHLGVGARRCAGRFEQHELAAGASIEETAGTLLERFET